MPHTLRSNGSHVKERSFGFGRLVNDAMMPRMFNSGLQDILDKSTLIRVILQSATRVCFSWKPRATIYKVLASEDA